MYELDNEMVQELMDAFHDLYESIEGDLNKLVEDPSSERLNALFRAFHNIKGHAGMMQLSALVDYAHSMEDVAECLRSGKITPTTELVEGMQLGIDRLRDLHYRDVLQQNFPNLEEHAIQAQFTKIASASPDQVDCHVNELLRCLSGGYHNDTDREEPAAAGGMQNAEALPLLTGQNRQFLDLAFFQELSFQVDNQNPFWVDRSIQLYDWAQKLNCLAGDKVEYQQLAAATYMHDIGMCFVRADILHKTDKLSPEEIKEIRRHTAWGYDWLVRMPGWEEAALIILNHHERVDGSGYPNRLTDTLIHPGAKILAILDAFFSMIKGRADRTQRKSILRAMAEINAAKGSQFDAYWVDLFNQVIKDEVKSGML